MSSDNDWETSTPSHRAVFFGRIIVCVVGIVLLVIGGWFSYSYPHEQVLFTGAVLTAGLVLVWLGISLPAKVVAHLGFWLPWFTE